MKISYNWLQKYFEAKLPEPEIVADGIIFHAFEIEEMEKIGDDTIFEIKILPDRAHDCLSHWGIAKEVSVIFNLKMKMLAPLPRQGLDKGDLEIEVKDNHCRRYMGQIIRGVKISPSPAWLALALTSIGQKSINNVVDATNYVMFDLGNPIHAFDLDKLASPKIIVGPALAKENFTLLDGKDVVLDEKMLTIRDEKEALVVAGVKGGKKAEVNELTSNIMIEVANFVPVTVRKAAQKLGIFTESAKRFENEISPTLAPLAMEAITRLILEVAGGEAGELVDVYQGQEISKNIQFTRNYLNNLLGLEIPPAAIDDILHRFNYNFKLEGETYQVEISPLRLDLTGPHDLAEEIGRIYGYEKIIPTLPQADFHRQASLVWSQINLAKAYLSSQGFSEVMNYTFANKGEVEIMASASDKNFLRTNLIDGLKKSFELNKLNAPLFGQSEIKIFEIGTVFASGQETLMVGTAHKKEIKELALADFIKSLPVDFISSLSQGLTTQKYFKPWSVYPFMTRDIAVWLPIEEKAESLKQILKEEGTNLLIKEPTLFDSFSKDGRTSYAYRLVFQSYDKTLTDEEINPIMEKINQKISAHGWQVR